MKNYKRMDRKRVESVTYKEEELKKNKKHENYKKILIGKG